MSLNTTHAVRYADLIEATEKYGREVWEDSNYADVTELPADVRFELDFDSGFEKSWDF